jgi:predicted phosphodiesterase
MKIAIIADVHGNLPALEAVLAELGQVQPDLVAHGGDLAFDGPQPKECLDVIREHGWPGVMGNTDELIARGGVEPSATWVRERLGPGHMLWLKELRRSWRYEDQVALVHATPEDLWTRVLPDTDDAELRAIYSPLGARMAVYCHIHRPYVREIGSLTVANTGSVGMPFDGDARASFLLISDGICQIRRVAYEVERAAAEMERSGHPDASAIANSYRTGRPWR